MFVNKYLNIYITYNKIFYNMVFCSQDILVFLTGKEEIEAMASNIRLITKVSLFIL